MLSENPQLSQIAGSYINFSIGAKSKLSAIKKFFPENVFIGRFDKLGGVFHDSTRSKLFINLKEHTKKQACY